MKGPNVLCLFFILQIAYMNQYALIYKFFRARFFTPSNKPNSISYYVDPVFPKPKLFSLSWSINVKLTFDNYQTMTANQIQ